MKKAYRIVLVLAAMLLMASAVMILSSCSNENPAPSSRETAASQKEETIKTGQETETAKETASQTDAQTEEPSEKTEEPASVTDEPSEEAPPSEPSEASPSGEETESASEAQGGDITGAAFLMNDGTGTVFETQEFEGEARLSKPGIPEREGYLFGGWYEDADFSSAFNQAKKYSSGQKFYAQWLKLFVLEAENTQLTGLDYENDETGTVNQKGNKIGHNRSGDMAGTQLIQKSDLASGGMFVAGLYMYESYLEFVIRSDRAAEGVRLYVSLSAEFKDYELTRKDLGIEVNGETIRYSDTISLRQDQPFQDYLISAEVSLSEGENVIRLVILNDEKQFEDGTVYAAAPTIDCIKLYSTSEIEMTRYNTDITG